MENPHKKLELVLPWGDTLFHWYFKSVKFGLIDKNLLDIICDTFDINE